MKVKNDRAGIYIVLFCGMIWGLGGVLGQLLFQNSDMTPGLLSAIRMFISGSCILAYTVIKKGRGIFRVFRGKGDLLSFLFFCIAGVMAMQYSYFAAVEASNAATATVLQYTYPLMILAWTSVEQKKFPRLYELVAIIAAFIGIVLIATGGRIDSLRMSTAALLWGIGAAVSFVIYTVWPKALYRKYGMAEMIGWSMLLGGILLFFLAGKRDIPVEVTPLTVFLTLFITFGSSLIPMLLYGKGVSILGNIKASLFVTVEPVFCAVISALFHLKKFSAVDIVGFLLILIPIEAVALLSARQEAKGNKKEEKDEGKKVCEEKTGK